MSSIFKAWKYEITWKHYITKVKNGENLPHLQITEAVLVQCNNVSNEYQQHSRVVYTFVGDKLLCQI